VLLVLAALTSIISMHETPTAFVSEEFRMGRKNGARIVTVLAMITGALCSLSLGPVPELQLFGKSLFDFFDFLSANILLTLGGFLTSIYVGWVMPHKAVHDQMTNWGTLSSRYFHLFVFAAKYVCPLGMLFIFLHQFGWV
jgi:NSS family neurotransmitter:Na+ symporter